MKQSRHHQPKQAKKAEKLYLFAHLQDKPEVFRKIV
jgi:hypothetical protein